LTEQARDGLLAGVRVLDLGRVLAAPFCGLVLADFGAEVIKVEPPAGDDARRFGPFHGGASTYHRFLNRNKLGIVLDLKEPEGRARFERLVERSDVVIENFRPGALERLGLAPARLAELNPRLVVVSITGFGQTGPLARDPAYDLIVQAMSGLMSVTGPDGGEAVRVGVSLGDLVPGLYAALGCLAALHERERSGRGQHVDVSMFDGLLSLLESVAMRALHTDEELLPTGSHHAISAPFGTFRTADEPVAVAIANEPLFARFAEALGHPEWTSDPRFTDDAARAHNRRALQAEIEAVFERMRQDEILALLAAQGIPCSPVLDPRAALAHEQTAARSMVVEEADGFRTLASPLKLRGSVGVRRPAPALGEHNGLIESWLAEQPRTGQVTDGAVPVQ
jgi:CoA:oxalate CoA-transferase